MVKAGRRALIPVWLLIFFLSIQVCRPLTAFGGGLSTLSSLQPMSLTIVGLNGSQVLLDEGDIGGLESYEARGGYKNVLGIIRGMGNYTGVPVTVLCGLVGGFSEGNSLRVTASDGYNMTFSYAQVNGDFVTYDPVSGVQVNHSQPLMPVLAYFKDGLNLTSGDGGPLRFAIVGPEGLATDSKYWVKYVVKLEVRLRDDVAVTELTLSRTIVGQSYSCHVNVSVWNKGDYSESFSARLYANSTVIGTIQNVALSSGSSTLLQFVWNTSTYVKGRYNVSAYILPVPGETDTVDNAHFGGWVTVTIPGDVDGNFKVDIMDVVKITGCYNAKPGDLRFNLYSDLNYDGSITIFDVVICTSHYGQKYP